ncbi:ParA family protein [Selenomonas ruminantium]|uniref:ParA family protein n=1 Tax=Selenomonas ruminantium TaxID=971 RepID=UPI00042567DB|nr:ParA family protein [Selenomonas ruminantium]
MKVLTIANLKGGVGKTVTTINASYLLATGYGKNVLLVDNDQQGNCSQFFGVYGYDKPSMTDVMKRNVTAEQVIQHTEYAGLDIIPANLSLAEAEKAVLMDSVTPQQVRLREILRQVKDEYDYVLIDNAPSLGMCVINSLATSDYLIIPAKIDKFTFDGIACLLNQLKTVKEYFNPQIELLGTLITSYRRNDTNQQGAEWLKQAEKYKAFDSHIRWTDKMDESTFTAEPVMVHSPRCGAAKDYKAFVEELLRMVEG